MGNSNEQKIWNRLRVAGMNAYGAAGAMGNLEKESGLNPQNLQNTGNSKLGLTDEEYTQKVDSGEYENFVKDKQGYGLAQWTYWSRKQALLNFAKASGKSIGDLEMQLDFFIKELKENYPAVWNVLKTAKSVKEASNIMLFKYEAPANQNTKVQNDRTAAGQTFYDKFAGSNSCESSANGGKCYAASVIAVATAEIGYTEKETNSQLDSKTANAGDKNYTKYARDFDQKWPKWYNGKKNGFAWCDMFVDWCFLTAYGYEAALRLLCQSECSAGAGCTYSLGYYQKKGQFHTNNPQMGDQIFFGSSTSNSNHTGIVEKVENAKVYTIEGNASNQVARRSYALNASNIIGYGRPTYDVESSVATKTLETVAAEVVAGKWGNGSERKKRLEEAGFNYAVIQKLVNEMLR